MGAAMSWAINGAEVGGTAQICINLSMLSALLLPTWIALDRIGKQQTAASMNGPSYSSHELSSLATSAASHAELSTWDDQA